MRGTSRAEWLADEVRRQGDHMLAEHPALTPIERHGGYLVKRDDLFTVCGVAGGKARTCWALAQGERNGLVTAGSRSSPQVNIVAHIAQALGIPCRAHIPTGELGPDLLAAQRAGAEIVQHRPGHNSVIVARARADAYARDWREIPFGMECEEAVRQTAAQVYNLPAVGIERIVVPVGSGMSLAGILHGLQYLGAEVPVLGVVVGADPLRRLDRYAPLFWRQRCTLVPATVEYDVKLDGATLGDTLRLDSHYEAKCLDHLERTDLLWVVGIRESEATA